MRKLHDFTVMQPVKSGKKTNIPYHNMLHEAFEIFGWTLIDGFDDLKLYFHRLPTKAANVS